MSLVDVRPVAFPAQVIVWIACGLGIAGMFLPMLSGLPRYDWLAPFSLVLPPIAFFLMLAAPEAFGVTRRNTGKRTLNVFPAVSVVGLIVSASHIGLVNWRLALIPAGLCAAIALLLGVGLAGRRLPGGLWLSIAFWACFGGAYGYGAMVFADIRFDQGQSQVYQAEVQRQYLSYSRRSSTPHLVLGPWGSLTGTTDIAVSSAAYAALGPGQTACVTLHPGRLGMAWFAADVCGGT